jgi:hypothetical protein
MRSWIGAAVALGMVFGAAACELAVDLGPYEAGCGSALKYCPDPNNGGKPACINTNRWDVGCGEPGCTSCAARIPHGAAFTCSPGGTCVVTMCETPFQNCGDNACDSNMLTDQNNCGQCHSLGTAANCDVTTGYGPNISNLSCQSGLCKVSICETGFADCNNDPADGCETMLSSSNCWSCPADKGGSPCPCLSCVGRPFACPTCMGGPNATFCDITQMKCVEPAADAGSD